MKRVLITGAQSYVGINVRKWLMNKPEKFHVETLDMRDANWKNFDFSKFDVVFHVAGIVHVKEKKNNQELYYNINEKLAIDTLEIAKKSGVSQFIFMSTMSVYGIKKGEISSFSDLNPKSSYGTSKLNAEIYANKQNSSNFKVAIIRSPMIYGLNARGNFMKLLKLSFLWGIYPNIKNKRSMLYIDNLSKYIEAIITKSVSGTICPRDPDYLGTLEIITLLRNKYNKKTYSLTILNPITYCLKLFVPSISKMFDNLFYNEHVEGGAKFVKEHSIILESSTKSIQRIISGFRL